MQSSQIIDPDSAAYKKAAMFLHDGGIVICPSDANYAIGVNPFNPSAVVSCFNAKKRAGAKPLTLFIAEPDDWRQFATVRNIPLMERLVHLYWPGPLNIVIDKNDRSPNLSLAPNTTISIACHANPVLRNLLRAFGGPIAMTSANLSGMSDGGLVDIDTALKHVGPSVKMVLRGAPVETTTSTTIVQVEQDMTLLREGDLKFKSMQSSVRASISTYRG